MFTVSRPGDRTVDSRSISVSKFLRSEGGKGLQRNVVLMLYNSFFFQRWKQPGGKFRIEFCQTGLWLAAQNG